MERQLDMHALFRRKVTQEEQKLRVYDSVLENVHERIQQTASAAEGDFTFTTFILPEVMIGQPLFNKEQCRSYIMTSLVKNGFRVKYTHPNFLMISWEHLRSQYDRANEVITKEQQELIEKENLRLQEEARKQEERLNRAYLEQNRRIASDPRNHDPAETRRLVRAADDYIPSSKLRDVYFSRQN